MGVVIGIPLSSLKTSFEEDGNVSRTDSHGALSNRKADIRFIFNLQKCAVFLSTNNNLPIPTLFKSASFSVAFR